MLHLQERVLVRLASRAGGGGDMARQACRLPELSACALA